jgi:hypothetical protein
MPSPLTTSLTRLANGVRPNLTFAPRLSLETYPGLAVVRDRVRDEYGALITRRLRALGAGYTVETVREFHDRNGWRTAYETTTQDFADLASAIRALGGEGWAEEIAAVFATATARAA